MKTEMNLKQVILRIMPLLLICLAGEAICQEYKSGSLSPANWTADQWELAKRTGTGTEGAATGREHMLINTGMPEAAYAGFTVLEQGGNAMDAALTAALADITIKTGNSVSFAGFMNLIYYNAKTGKVHGMNAGWNTPLEEKDPMSIPDYGSETPSGRTALVPGFMAGLGEAHQKFGKLPFGALLDGLQAVRYAFSVARIALLSLLILAIGGVSWVGCAGDESAPAKEVLA